ncbi:MAG: hypothetical protein N2111_09755 [Candidatus Sumerlaeaceae bacterium]|nr:hypothetical protein [Candidatus Sumerlaeaceae bacterium]
MATVETFEVGDKIKHPKFGQGTIRQRWGEGDRLKVLVSFSPEWGDKKLMVKQAKIKKVAVAERPALASADEVDPDSIKALDAVESLETEEDDSEADEEETEE